MPNSQRLPPSTTAPPPEIPATEAVLHDPAALALKQSERDLQRERRMLRRLIDIQEKERQLVSYEIHDGLAQYIAGAIMHRTGHSLSPGPMVHGLGMNLDNLETHDTRQMLPGIGFTIEPGAYLPKENFGVRNEINVYVDPAKGPVVTSGMNDEPVWCG